MLGRILFSIEVLFFISLDKYRWLVWNMCTLYAPFLWVKVVSTVPEVLCKAYWIALISKENDTTWSLRRECDSLMAKIGNGCLVVNFYTVISRFVRRDGESQRVVRNNILTLLPTFFNPMRKDAEVFVGIC